MDNNIRCSSLIILGSTGSVGTQALDVAALHSIRIDALAAKSDVKAIESQARYYKPRFCAMADEGAAIALKSALADTPVKVFSGISGICDMIEASDADTVVNSILSFDGLLPSVSALKSKKRLALANKESLVTAGELIMPLAKVCGTQIIPVDSEHSAIWQCIGENRRTDIKRLILTASGGPFFGFSPERLRNVTLEDTLRHPTWRMGKKITVDSATLANKAFEIIEAVRLFDVLPSQVEVVVHRQSIIHSMVEYIDNAVLAQLSAPDMRLCVQYALTCPARFPSPADRLDFTSLSSLTFEKPDFETFPLLPLTYEVLNKGGVYPAVFNAADEVAVSAFLSGKIGFTDIFDIVENSVMTFSGSLYPLTLEGIISADNETRHKTAAMIENSAKKH